MKSLLLALCSALLVMLLFSCATRKTVARNDLFSLPYGPFGDELSLFNTSAQAYPEASFSYYKGRFLLGSRVARRLQIFTSYGDVYRYYYNPKYSPVALDLTDLATLPQGSVSSGFAHKMPLGLVGRSAVDGRFLYLEERLTSKKGEETSALDIFSWESGRRLSQISEYLDHGQPRPFGKILHIIPQGKKVYLLTREASRYVILSLALSSEGKASFAESVFVSASPKSFGLLSKSVLDATIDDLFVSTGAQHLYVIFTLVEKAKGYPSRQEIASYDLSALYARPLSEHKTMMLKNMRRQYLKPLPTQKGAQVNLPLRSVGVRKLHLYLVSAVIQENGSNVRYVYSYGLKHGHLAKRYKLLWPEKTSGSYSLFALSADGALASFSFGAERGYFALWPLL